MMVLFGTDVELFVCNRKGKVIDSSKFFKGLHMVENKGEMKHEVYDTFGETSGFLKQDGVLLEIEVIPASCRQILSWRIARLVAAANKIARKRGYKLSLKTGHEFNKEEFDSLPEDSKKLGCMPSKNAYADGLEIPLGVNGEEYRIRTTGGHIHIGIYDNPMKDNIKRNVNDFIKLLDLMLGNTMVLLDREEFSKTRRKVYGRAGEYRTRTKNDYYIVEYRTLSNFWFRSYPLMSFVTGTARVCADFIDKGIHKEILKLVDEKDVKKAINENDYDLALKNLNKIREHLENIKDTSFLGTGILSLDFYETITKIAEKQMFKDKFKVLYRCWNTAMGWERLDRIAREENNFDAYLAGYINK